MMKSRSPQKTSQIHNITIRSTRLGFLSLNGNMFTKRIEIEREIGTASQMFNAFIFFLNLGVRVQ